MKEENLTPEQIQAIREAFDHAIKDGPWQESNFLRTMGKRLENIRDDFLFEVGQKSGESADSPSSLDNREELKSGHQEVFISLYNSSGDQISAWERVIANLPRQLISRPIYADEQNITALIKSKGTPKNEAYVCAYINKEYIKDVPEDKIPHDRLNHPLLTVKDRALSLDDITRFVHLSGTYKYEEGRLVKSPDSPSS